MPGQYLFSKIAAASRLHNHKRNSFIWIWWLSGRSSWWWRLLTYILAEEISLIHYRCWAHCDCLLKFHGRNESDEYLLLLSHQNVWINAVFISNNYYFHLCLQGKYLHIYRECMKLFSLNNAGLIISFPVCRQRQTRKQTNASLSEICIGHPILIFVIITDFPCHRFCCFDICGIFTLIESVFGMKLQILDDDDNECGSDCMPYLIQMKLIEKWQRALNMKFYKWSDYFGETGMKKAHHTQVLKLDCMHNLYATWSMSWTARHIKQMPMKSVPLLRLQLWFEWIEHLAIKGCFHDTHVW